jgi:hypothetical protein
MGSGDDEKVKIRRPRRPELNLNKHTHEDAAASGTIGGPMMNVVKGNFFLQKSNSPVKVCQVCGDMIPMTRRAARDWEQIQFCSAVCRRSNRLQQPQAKAS